VTVSDETAAPTLPATLLSDARKALASVEAALAPHLEQIRQEWRRVLSGVDVDEDELTALSGLTLSFESADLKAGDFDSFLRNIEREGQALAGRGVSVELALSALFVRYEVSLPFLLRGAKRQAAAKAAALLRLTVMSALTVRAQYDSARRSSWRSFDERERLRLSRDLHDEIGHQLVVLKLYLELIAKELPKGPRSNEVRQKLTEALTLVTQSLQSVRRLILDLGPAVLEEVGLLAAIGLYAQQFSARTGVQVEVRDMGASIDLPASHATALYRVLQGALSNVLKHAEARHVTISLGLVRSVVVMVIEDDGVGFDPSVPRQAFGLQAMRERIEGLGGRFHLESRQGGPGRRKSGTRIEIDLPYPNQRP
jgi:signal transduction histidine kinase